MESILILGDPHFKKDNLHLMRLICDEILQKIDELKIHVVISLGDTLDTHERIHMEALCFAAKFYKEIAKKVKLKVLVGNHDRLNNQQFLTDIHPFPGLEEYPNITIVWTTIWDKEEDIIYVPYVPPGRFYEALAMVGYIPGDKVKPKFIVAHQEIRGTIMGIKVSAHGDRWDTSLPLIISGHIHEHQTLPGVLYPGTFVQQNYGEIPNKAITLMTLDGEDWIYQRIPLKSAPIRTTLHIRIPDLEKISEKLPPGHLVKVIIHLDATESRDIEKNPYFKALKGTVDKVVKKVEGNKANIAENMVKEMKNKGALKPSEKGTYRVEEIVRAMLKDDPGTLQLFELEIIN